MPARGPTSGPSGGRGDELDVDGDLHDVAEGGVEGAEADAEVAAAHHAALAGPLGILDAEPPNLTFFTFTDRRARSAYPDWDRVATEQAGEEFTRRWDARPVERKTSGTKRLRHPEVGELAVEFETMQLADRDDQRLVVYLPADEATAAAFDQLSGRRPGALHAVGG